MQNLIAEAEKRGQKSLDDALSKKAEQPKIIGDKGIASPEDIGHDMTKEVAANILFEKGEYVEFLEKI